MRKLMLMASMLAMVLLAASPAMAQQEAVAGDGSNICQQIIEDAANVSNENNASIDQGNQGDQTVGDSSYVTQNISDDDAAAIAQQNNTSVEVVQNCLQGSDEGTVDTAEGETTATQGTDDSGQVATTDDGSNICQQIIEDAANVSNENNASIDQGNQGDQTVGDSSYVTQNISDDDAAAIAQQNNTSVEVVQNCLQGSDEGTVDAPEAIDVADENNDGVVDEEEAQNIADEETADVVAEADTNGDGTVDQAEAQAVATAGDAAANAEAGDAAANAEAGDAAANAEAGDAAANAEAGDAAANAEADDADAGAVAVLPDTGGASLFTLGAGALLVAGGLLARRIVR